HTADGHNPLCGDQLTVYAIVKDGVVEQASFVGHGCAISTASASLMTEAVKGKPVDEVESLFRDMHAKLTEAHPEARDFGKLEVLSGVREFPARVKCATLAWHTLHNAITRARDTARTELEVHHELYATRRHRQPGLPGGVGSIRIAGDDRKRLTSEERRGGEECE